LLARSLSIVQTALADTRMLTARHLGVAKSPWVVSSTCAPDVLRSIVRREFPDLFVALIPGRACQTKRGLFDTFADVLQFPVHFGRNWDAFEECINDLTWLKAGGYLLLVSEAEALLARSEKDHRIFVDIMSEAGQAWSEASRRKRPFHVVLVSATSTGARRRPSKSDLALGVP
jgi:hypothetical protein